MPKRKRGGQPGNRNAKGKGAPPKNRNAKGHGAPKKNKNAETHGAYSKVHLENLSADERAYIESITLDVEENMLRELQILNAKERDLAAKINKYEDDEIALHVEKEIVTETDKGEVTQTFKSSSLEIVMKLNAEYSKTHGRILKLIDSMRAYAIDCKRLDFDKRKHEFNKQRAKGAFNINPDTDEIEDSYEDETE
ncbi:MAG: hypothetical protein FWD48_01110 [Oscillospiraceae bacterium]|nr:hypothetical protein [Oscillospiraceae bacterium]